MTQPITPDEARVTKPTTIPDEIFDVFNALIVKDLNGQGYATVYLEDVKDRLDSLGLDTTEAYANHWYDVEPFYREAGWKVTYDQPVGYAGESFRSHYDFEAPR